MSNKPGYIPSTLAGKGGFKLGPELKAAKQQFECGFAIGTVDALFLCLGFGMPVPEWVQENFPDCLLEVLSLGPHKGKGSKARPPSALRADLRHFNRYDAVQRAAELGLKGEAKLKMAESLLSGTTSACGIPTIVNSNKIVRRALKKPGGIARFRYPRSLFVRDLVWTLTKS